MRLVLGTAAQFINAAGFQTVSSTDSGSPFFSSCPVLLPAETDGIRVIAEALKHVPIQGIYAPLFTNDLAGLNRTDFQVLREMERGDEAYIVPTSITSDYRSQSWRERRIVLDAISNHLPGDSKASQTKVLFRQGDEWVDLEGVRPTEPISEIQFTDDGEGYEADLLTLLWSGKKDDVQSIGQFGEGSKMVSAAACRLGIDVEFQSKNWTAVPFLETKRIKGREVEVLNFRVTKGREFITGSRTIFKNPSAKLVGEILLLREHVLHFNRTYREICRKAKWDDLFAFLSNASAFDMTPYFDEYTPLLGGLAIENTPMETIAAQTRTPEGLLAGFSKGLL